MNEESYPFASSPDEFRYEFVSVSEKKKVQKVVLLTQSKVGQIYNLALLDELDDGRLCDITETRNNDLRIVIATVIQITDDFLTKNPDSYVIFRGSDVRRHRLYSIVIGRELSEFSRAFEIFGVINSVRYPFEINKSYEFYLIKKNYENVKKDFNY